MRVLVTYATLSGSTAAVAEAVGEELRGAGLEADVLPLEQATRPGDYDAVIVGGPMIRGWHKAARRYVGKHRDVLANRRLALFVTAMSLTDTGEDVVEGIPLAADPSLARAPANEGRLGLKERYARPSRYLRGALAKAPDLRPATVAFFHGSLDLTALSLWQKLFVLLIVRASPGDARNWPFIREWARGLPAAFGAPSATTSDG